MSRPRWPAALGLLCLLVVGLGALWRYPPAARVLGDRRSSAVSRPVLDGIPRVGGVPALTPEFLVAVRRVVPRHDRVRVLEGRARACHDGPGQLFWIAYHLAPRVMVCDRSARWWVLYQAGPVPLPPGSRVVVSMRPDLRLVDTDPGAGR